MYGENVLGDKISTRKASGDSTLETKAIADKIAAKYALGDKV